MSSGAAAGGDGGFGALYAISAAKALFPKPATLRSVTRRQARWRCHHPNNASLGFCRIDEHDAPQRRLEFF